MSNSSEQFDLLIKQAKEYLDKGKKWFNKQEPNKQKIIAIGAFIILLTVLNRGCTAVRILTIPSSSTTTVKTIKPEKTKQKETKNSELSKKESAEPKECQPHRGQPTVSDGKGGCRMMTFDEFSKWAIENAKANEEKIRNAPCEGPLGSEAYVRVASGIPADYLCMEKL